MRMGMRMGMGEGLMALLDQAFFLRAVSQSGGEVQQCF